MSALTAASFIIAFTGAVYLIAVGFSRMLSEQIIKYLDNRAPK